MTQRDRELLDTLRRRTEQAENEGDLSFFEGAAARNIVLMPPNFRAVVGRAAAIDFIDDAGSWKVSRVMWNATSG
jgi:hypothetical protein